jgi:hypothetical protein
MPAKITNSILEGKMGYIERNAKVKLYLQSQSLGKGAGFQLIQNLPDGSEHVVNNGLLNRSEMLCYLDGIIDGLDNFGKVWS